MSSKHPYHFGFLLFRRLLVALGFMGALGSATHASASVEHERKALEMRVTALRDLILQKKNETKPGNLTEPIGDKLVQWYPWGNWRNWRNW